MTSSPLIERLEATRDGGILGSAGVIVARLINPDGPEAAALIRELVEALTRINDTGDVALDIDWIRRISRAALSRAKATSND